MTTTTFKMQNTISELHKAFDLLNETFYNGELPTPMITVAPAGKKPTYGHFTPYHSWSDKEGETQMVEINLSSEYLNESYQELMNTLHHEMLHLYNYVNEVKDTSKRGRYHNTKFKQSAEEHGFTFDHMTEAHPKIGWSDCKFTPETTELIENFDLDRTAFKMARIKPTSKVRKQRTTYLHECEECGESFKLRKQVDVTCTNCEIPMTVTES